MGNSSSRYVKRSEHNVHMESIQRMLDSLKLEHDRFHVDVRQVNKRLFDEIKSVTEVSESQRKSSLTTEQEMESLKTEIIKLSELDEFKLTLKKLSLEQNEDRMRLAAKMKELIAKERGTWDNDVFDLKERYETMRKYSMELVSMDLSHEREIKVLQRRISNMDEKREASLLRKSVSSADSIVTQKSSTLDENHLKDSSYDLKFSKINMAIQRLKEDMKYADNKRSRSQF